MTNVSDTGGELEVSLVNFNDLVHDLANTLTGGLAAASLGRSFDLGSGIPYASIHAHLTVIDDIVVHCLGREDVLFEVNDARRYFDDLRGEVFDRIQRINGSMAYYRLVGGNRYLGVIDNTLRKLQQAFADYNPTPVSCDELNRVDLGSLIRDTLDEWGHGEGKNITHHVNLHYDGDIVASQRGIRLILKELVRNAVKYTPADDGEYSLTVSMRKYGSHLYISVRDEGIGVDTADTERVFARGHVVHLTAEKHALIGSPRRLGIGLYGIDHFARSIGCGVGVAPNFSGEGSTFYISIPVPADGTLGE